jgi:CubicO group peptidase (beta-lactamase class C family)
MKLDRLFRLLFVAVLVPAPGLAQLPAGAASRVDEVFARWNSRETPGCAVGVARSGESILARAYGMADLEHDVAATPATIYEAGSVSKQFTAASVILLAQQGKLSLDDDVRKHVPEVPDYGSRITIRHLLNHTSGLRDWGSVAGIGGWPRGNRMHTHAHMLDIVSRQRALNYPPGAAYSYTNTGYNLLAVIVDRVSGIPFAEFSKRNLFEPLGMTSTEWRDDYTRIVKDRSIAYAARGGGRGRGRGADPAGPPSGAAAANFSTDMPFENVHGNGGLLTTVGDLLIWTENLETGRVGGPAFLEEMHRQGVLTNSRTITYASGLQVQTYNGVPEVSHTGSTAGYRAFLGRYPQQRLAVAVLCNIGSVNPGSVGHAVADVFLGNVTTPARGGRGGRGGAGMPQRGAGADDAGVAVPRAELEAKAGLYREPKSGESIRLTFGDSGLRLGNTALVAISRTEFRAGGQRRLTFEPMPGNQRPRIRELTPEGPDPSVVFEPVPEFNPTAADLAQYAGEYYSPDADATIVAAVEDGQLVLRRRPATRMTLTPAYPDAFDSGGGLGRVRFHRDARGRVTQLSVRQSRVWDLRFDRR